LDKNFPPSKKNQPSKKQAKSTYLLNTTSTIKPAATGTNSPMNLENAKQQKQFRPQMASITSLFARR
jgi:hypothetical protein